MKLPVHVNVQIATVGTPVKVSALIMCDDFGKLKYIKMLFY